MIDLNKASQAEQAIKDNSSLNGREFSERKIILTSSPKEIFIQAAGPCNANCVFCSRGSDYEIFDLGTFQKRFKDKLFPFISKAEQLVLTGSGEFLQLPDSEAILDFFDNEFPFTAKMFSTNGSSLKPHICEKIVNSKSKYLIHVSLHASNAKLHRMVTRMDTFYTILGQLKYLLDIRKKTNNPSVYLYFVATNLNIEDLPNFVRLGHQLGVDKIICYYNYIYIPTQKYLSCFFKQDLANAVLREAKDLASKLGVSLELPPEFGLGEYSKRGICSEAWSQMMVDASGKVLPCDASEDWNENLQEKDFMEIWNGQAYQDLRKALVSRSASCLKHCFRANPACINNFNSHVIFRGKKDDTQVDVLWGENF